MKFLEVVTPPPDIYHGCSTRNKFLEEKFAPVNMKSYGRRNVRRHREIKNGEQYIILEISYDIYCMDKREDTPLESRHYMARTGKGMTTYMDFREKSPNNKKNASFDITGITNQDFSYLIRKFKKTPYIV